MLKLKRAYDGISKQDGKRILVDGIWPRGVSKEGLSSDEWYRSLAPSKELREWFDHDPDKWGEFKKRYFKELDSHKDMLREIKEQSDDHNITLLYGAKDEKYNQAAAIREYIENMD
ncbi:DUF488 domain-containing protein [Salinicoccus luteus]|uniref:DUF488 domain-containing protein n=1 Tax=Salinicoccus luteus TaxID=367840 RepID=UPI0004E28641|nr:DUF488 family protein [Salinicoccus luteus]